LLDIIQFIGFHIASFPLKRIKKKMDIDKNVVKSFLDPPDDETSTKAGRSFRLIHSTAPNPDFQIGVKSAAQY